MKTHRSLPAKYLNVLAVMALAGFSATTASAQVCGASNGPDVVVGNLTSFLSYGTVGGISGYAFGTVSCNYGTQVLPWIATSNKHPVIGMNAYRLMNGRFEQIGLSWVKHGWGASTENFCCTCINPQNFYALGVGCSDPYDAATNGLQGGLVYQGQTVSGLGPRSDINSSTGAFVWPYGTLGVTGNAIYKRLQIRLADLDPALNPGAMYFAEGQYITPDDAGVNALNNVSYRRFTVGALNSGAYTLTINGTYLTQRQKPALQAWADNDASVLLQSADIEHDGRYQLACKVTNNGNGTWHYEYAMYNMNSHKSLGSFRVPIPQGVTVTNVGFHDVDYHSGEIYDGTDWPSSLASGFLKWATTPETSNPNANALRWGTVYNFRFDANSPPKMGVGTGETFRGLPQPVVIAAQVPRRPGDVDGNDAVNVLDLLAVINAWGRCPVPPTACPADVSPPGGDGQVNVGDLLMVINNWG